MASNGANSRTVIPALVFLLVFGALFGANPSIGFGSGTLDSGVTAASNYAFANITLYTAVALRNFTFNWNGANYPIYDDSLAGMWNFEDMNYSDNFDGSSINSVMWSYSSPGASIVSNKLRLNSSSGSQIVRQLSSNGKWNLTGNFDIQVDFSDVQTTSATESDSSLRIYDATNSSNFFEIKKSITAGAMAFQAYCSGSVLAGSNATSLTSGKYRIVKSSSLLSFYYYDTGAWKQTGSCATPATVFYVIIFNWNSGPAYPAIVTDFDNFQINSGQPITDASKNSNNGSFAGTYSARAGKYGNALSFNGASNYVNAGNVGNVRTASYWINSNSNYAYVLNFNDANTNNYIYHNSVPMGIPSYTVYVDGASSSQLGTELVPNGNFASGVTGWTSDSSALTWQNAA